MLDAPSWPIVITSGLSGGIVNIFVTWRYPKFENTAGIAGLVTLAVVAVAMALIKDHRIRRRSRTK